MTKNPQTMIEKAALELRRAIMQGELSPGMRLVPAKLEKKLGFSRISIREAIRELVGTGLVESASNKGACVAEPLDIDEIRDIFDVRYHIEGKAAALGARHISESDIIRMELIHEKIMAAETMPEIFFLNQEFHMILYRASGWRYLIKTIERLYDQVLVFRSFLTAQAGEVLLEMSHNKQKFDSLVDDHARILELVRARESDKLKETIEKHLQEKGFETIYDVYKEILKNGDSV